MVKVVPAAHFYFFHFFHFFYFFYFFYFDLDGHFGLPCILNKYVTLSIYFYILFSFVSHGTPGLHHSISVRNADPAYEAIHYASENRSRR